MQHIVNIAFDFDDEKVRSIAEKTVENDLGKIVRELVLDAIAPMEQRFYSQKPSRSWDRVNDLVIKTVKESLADRIDDIIDLAAQKIAISIKATKKWKEKYGEVEEELFTD